jgi:hypothetical protein
VPEQMVNEWLSEFQTGSDPCAASAYCIGPQPL